MRAIKVLENKIVIRLFGIALILAPFINLSLMIYFHQKELNIPWNTLPIKQILTSGTYTNYMLIFASLIIGIIMLRGSKSAWKYTLVLLGSYIILQIPHIGKDIRANWHSGVMFVVNLGLFVFIADQLVFKANTNDEKMQNVDDRLILVKKNIQIQFNGMNTKGKLLRISSKQLQIQFNSSTVNSLESKSAEIYFKTGLILTTKFKFQLDQSYYFDIIGMNPKQSEEYSLWLSQVTA